MNDIELKSKLLATAKYVSIIETIVASTGSISITKLLILSYLYMNNSFDKEIFERTKKNMFDKYLALLTSQKHEFFKSLEIIFDSILLLEDTNAVFIRDKVVINNGCKKKLSDSFLDKIITVSNIYSDSQILREVLNYV